MNVPALELALLQISLYPAQPGETNWPDHGQTMARLVKFTRPILADHGGFIYSQAFGEVKVAFLENSPAIICLTALQEFSQKSVWKDSGFNLVLKLSFELLQEGGQTSFITSEFPADTGFSSREEAYGNSDWLLARLAGFPQTGRPRHYPVDPHWYDFYNGRYVEGRDWLQKQLLFEQPFSKHLIHCLIALLNLRLGIVDEISLLYFMGVLGKFGGIFRDMSDEFLTYSLLVKIARANSEDPETIQEFEANAARLQTQIRAGRHYVAFLSDLGRNARLQKQPQAAFRLYQACLDWSRRTGDKFGEIIALSNLADTTQALRDYGKMSDLFDLTLDQLHLFEKGLSHPALLVVLAYLISEPGDNALATELLAESRRLSALTRKVNPLNEDLLALTEIALGLVPTEQLLSRHQKRLALAWRSLNPYSFSSALAGLSVLNLEKGLINEAKPTLKRAFNIALLGRNWPVLVEIIEKLAQFWLKQGQDKRATRLYGAAGGLRQRLNLTVSHLEKPVYEQDLDLLKNRLGPRLFKQAWIKGSNLPIQETLKIGLGNHPRLTSHLRNGQNKPNPEPAINGEAAPLSQREKEVLYLVATGLTNPQIARQMNLSTYTVSSYLRSIYNKLGVTTRTAAASYAFKNFYKLP